MRMPSSFHSTDASSKLSTASATSAAGEASIGSTGRNSSKPTARRPASPSVERDRGRARRGRRRACTRAASRSRRDAGRLRDRVDHDARERALPQLAREAGGAGSDCSSAVARASSSASAARRAPPEPLPVSACRPRDRRVDVGDGERRLGRGRTSTPYTVAYPIADPALARRAGEEADGDRHLAGLEPAQQVRQSRGLRRACGGRSHRGRGRDHVGEQGQEPTMRYSRPVSDVAYSSPAASSPNEDSSRHVGLRAHVRRLRRPFGASDQTVPLP